MRRLSNMVNDTLSADISGEFRGILQNFRFDENDIFTGVYSRSGLEAGGGMWGSEPVSTTTTVRSPLVPLLWLEDEATD